MANKVIKRPKRVSDPRPAIHAALGAGDIPRAARHAMAAHAAGFADPLVLNLVAWRREEDGDFTGAHALLRQALALAPGDVTIMGSIGAVLRKEGRPDEALAVLDRVVAMEPRHVAAWLERGYVLDDLREERAAAESYRRALALDPRLAPALGKLADGAARRGEAEQAQELAQRALAIDPAEPLAIAALATLANEARDGARAEALLRPLLTRPLKPEDRTRALTLLGDALDRQDRTADAFATWGEAQASFRAAHASLLAPGPSRPSHRDFIDAIARRIEADGPLAALPAVAPVAGEAARHIFLLGYPRSGTTLVENVLASAAGVVALEERDTLRDADEALVANDGAMPPLDALDPALVTRLRAAYWARVAALGAAVEGRTFVDMNPFNGIKLPVIARLFPNARIVIMRRDPRDVLLSCYRINFTPSPAAWAFSELEEAARHYDALMRLIEAARANLPLAYHELRYDRLVSDFEATVRDLASFVGLPWSDDFRRFDRTAQARGVRTASATQVRRGLYDGRGQWRRYAAELAPALPIVAPWVERFGFPA